MKKKDKFLVIFFIFCSFFVTYENALASPSSIEEVIPELSFNEIYEVTQGDFSSTVMYGTQVCPNGTGNSVLIRVYAGSFPDTSTAIETKQSGTCYNSSWLWGTEIGPNLTNFLFFNNSSIPYNDGDYWVYFFSDVNPSYYYNFTIQNDVIFEGPEYFISPTTPSGTVDTPVIFSGEFNAPEDYDVITIFLQEEGKTEQDDTLPITIEITPIMRLNGEYITSLNLVEGNYRSFASIVRRSDFDVLTTSEWVDFTIGGYELEECSTYDVFCHLRNFSTWLFTPKINALSKFKDLYDNYKNKPPFGYLSGIIDILNGVDSEEEAAFELESNSTITDNIFSPIRTGMVWLFWGIFAFSLFNRLKNIEL